MSRTGTMFSYDFAVQVASSTVRKIASLTGATLALSGVTYGLLRISKEYANTLKTNGLAFGGYLNTMRAMAYDTLDEVNFVDKKTGKVKDTLPSNYLMAIGPKLYELYLDGKDLKEVRAQLTTWLPTLPFAYFDECPCDMRLQIPYVMEATSFFSE